MPCKIVLHQYHIHFIEWYLLAYSRQFSVNGEHLILSDPCDRASNFLRNSWTAVESVLPLNSGQFPGSHWRLAPVPSLFPAPGGAPFLQEGPANVRSTSSVFAFSLASKENIMDSTTQQSSLTLLMMAMRCSSSQMIDL